MKDLIYFFKKYGIDKLRVLEIGCGYGYNFEDFQEGSLAIENRKEVVKILREKDLNVYNINVEDSYLNIEEKSFECCVIMDCLSHLVSPFKVLLEIRYILNDKGILLIQVPKYSRWFKSYISPEHFYTFNYRTIKLTLENAGFKVIEHNGYIRKFPLWLNKILYYPLRYFSPNLWIVAKKGDMKINNKSIQPEWIQDSIWNQK